jgi:hypothetical protein
VSIHFCLADRHEKRGCDNDQSWQPSQGGFIAFMHVPISLFDAGVAEVGVSSKQTGKARQAFMRSARQAGFFAQGNDRLVQPASPGTKPISSESNGDKQDKPTKEGAGGHGGGGGKIPPEIDPIIMGLLARLPKTGDVWPESERTLWLELLKGSFKLIYMDDDNQAMVQTNLRSLSGKDEAAN